MVARPLIDPRMLRRLLQFYPSLCTIETPVKTQDEFGEEMRTYQTVVGFEAIPCVRAPLSIDSPLSISEDRRTGHTEIRNVEHVSLRGAYPSITADMRAIIDGETWNILGSETDSHGTQTRLKVEQVTL